MAIAILRAAPSAVYLRFADFGEELPALGFVLIGGIARAAAQGFGALSDDRLAAERHP